MNEKFNKNAKVEQLTSMFLSREEEKGLIVKDPLLMYQVNYYTLLYYINMYTCINQQQKDNLVQKEVFACTSATHSGVLWQLSSLTAWNILAVVSVYVLMRSHRYGQSFGSFPYRSLQLSPQGINSLRR